MRLRLSLLLVVLGVSGLGPIAPAAPAWAGGASPPQADGGTRYDTVVPVPRASRGVAPVAREFRVSPRALANPSQAARITLRVVDDSSRVKVRLALLRATDRSAAASIELGRQRTGRRVVLKRRLGVQPGRYLVRLHVVDGDGRPLRRGARTSGRTTLTVRSPAPAPAPSVPTPPAGTVDGRFPVAGPYSFGGEGSRFGAGRDGHVHQGQDVSAAEGTPLVAPRAGTVTWRRYQESGAGHYLVIRGEGEARDYVFMHLRPGSIVVNAGDRVAMGQRIADVGNSGRSSGAHLHFEIWVGGWYEKGGAPIDPLPDLQRWAGNG